MLANRRPKESSPAAEGNPRCLSSAQLYLQLCNKSQSGPHPTRKKPSARRFPAQYHAPERCWVRMLFQQRCQLKSFLKTNLVLFFLSTLFFMHFHYAQQMLPIWVGPTSNPESLQSCIVRRISQRGPSFWLKIFSQEI